MPVSVYESYTAGRTGILLPGKPRGHFQAADFQQKAGAEKPGLQLAL
jgi:hypothetical protein